MLQSGAYNLKDKVSNLSDFPVLMAATHSDASPTPSHISQRVVSISFVSRQKCVHLMEHLLDIAQSGSKSLHSRVKAVRLLQELVAKGDPEFQALLQKEEHKLKAVSGFLDPQYPLESARLREATAALLEVLFEDTNRSLPPAPFVPPASSLGSVSSSYQRSQYQGFGNPHFVQNRDSSSSGILSLVSDKVSDLLSHVPPPDPNRFSRDYSGRPVDPPALSGYAQNSSFYPGARHSYPSQDTRLPDSFAHAPGTPGAEWDSPPLQFSGSSHEARANGACEREGEGQLERQLVTSFTVEGGVRNRPGRQELEEFTARCRSLDCCLLAALLTSQLAPQSTGSKLKTLFALEALYRSFPAQIGDTIAAHSDSISCLSANGDSPALRTKAREIISLLGLSVSPSHTSANNTLIQTDSNANNTLIQTDSNANNTLIQTDSNANNTLIQTDSNANNTLIQTDSNANNNLIQTDSNANNNLIQTDGVNITEELSAIASSALISTEPTDSLFEGMLTSQPEDTTLIEGLEEFAIPQMGTSKRDLSDMINLGTTRAPCEFDPLLEIGAPSVTVPPLSLTALNSSNLSNYSAPTTQPCSTMIPIQRQQPTKSVKNDSFGFISDHIQSLKGSK